LEGKDCFGRIVRIGDRIRIVGFSKQFMDSLLPRDHDQISEMICNEFEVGRSTKLGQAWVTMWWNSEDGEMDGHGIGLAPSEMELLSPGGTENSHAEADQ
jgi:hypothetical protein